MTDYVYVFKDEGDSGDTRSAAPGGCQSIGCSLWNEKPGGN